MAYIVNFFRKKTFTLSNRWHWRIKAVNGQIIARSTEGFYARQGAKENAMLTLESLAEHFECKLIRK